MKQFTCVKMAGPRMLEGVIITAQTPSLPRLTSMLLIQYPFHDMIIDKVYVFVTPDTYGVGNIVLLNGC